ncbi:MAG: hypothetical protein ACO35C_07745, partial [Pontimonas sp.]
PTALFPKGCLTLDASLSPLIPEITYYLSRVMPRGQQEADHLVWLIARLEDYGTRGKVGGHTTVGSSEMLNRKAS